MSAEGNGTPRTLARNGEVPSGEVVPQSYRKLHLEHLPKASPTKETNERDPILGGTPTKHPTQTDHVLRVQSAPAEPHKTAFTLNHASAFLLFWQVAMIFLFCTTTTFDDAYLPHAAPDHGAEATSTTSGAHYPMFQDTHIMMGIGFGFLYTLLRRYAWTGVGVNFLLCACTYQWAILCTGFWDNVRLLIVGEHKTFKAIPLNLEALINGDYVVATILISFGAMLGRISPAQALWMSFIEVIFCTGNVALCIGLGVNDAGGSMIIHIFGAAFGLAFAYYFGDLAVQVSKIGNGEDQLGTSRHNGTFAMIGTIFLFCFWPSFNAALLDGAAAGRAVVNTTLSIAGSACVAFAFSKAIHNGKYFDMEHVQNATLAGGVAIGCACDMILNPGYALLTGVIAGIVATYGFSFLTPMLKSRGLTDTCGIVNLHLIPGIIGGVCGAIAATTVKGDKWPDAAIAVAFPGRIIDGVPREAGIQAGFHVAVTMISLSMAVVSGALTAVMVRGCADPMYDNFYEDAGDWNVPEEYEEMPEFEDAVARAITADRDTTMREILKHVGKALGKDLLQDFSQHGTPATRLHLERAGRKESGRYSANYRFTEGSVHGSVHGHDSMHGRMTPRLTHAGRSIPLAHHQHVYGIEPYQYVPTLHTIESPVVPSVHSHHSPLPSPERANGVYASRSPHVEFADSMDRFTFSAGSHRGSA